MANKFSLTGQMILTPPSNLGKVTSQIQSKLNGISTNLDVKFDTRQASMAAVGLGQVADQSKRAKKEYSALTDVIGAGARRFAAITVVTSTFIGLTRSIKRSLGDAIEFEKKLTVLSQVTGKTVGQLGDLRDEINRISKAFGVSSDGLADTAITLSQAGYTAREVKDSLEVLAKTELAASFDNITNTTEGAIASLNQFKREVKEAGGTANFLVKSLGAINDVSKAYAVESDDLITAIRQTGGAFESAGGSLNELLGVFTSVRATTRESAETIATGLRTIFTRIQRVDTINALKQLGVELQDVEGKFVGPFEAIQRISKGLKSIDTRDIRFASIVEELGGFRQIGKVIPLLKESKLGVEALSVAMRANNSLSEDAEIAQNSLANKIDKVGQNFQALVRGFEQSSTFQSLTNGAIIMSNAFISLASSLEPLLPLLTIFAAVKLGQGFKGALGLGKRLNSAIPQLPAPLQRNAGGPIPGFGTGDTVPAMLTPGEFVMKKSAVQSIGLSALNRMNNGGQFSQDTQYFADGGVVSITPKKNKFGGLFLDQLGEKSYIDTEVNGLLLDVPSKSRSVHDILSRLGKTEMTENIVSQDKDEIVSGIEALKKANNQNKGLAFNDYVKKAAQNINTKDAYYDLNSEDEADQKNPLRHRTALVYEEAARLAKLAGVVVPTDGQKLPDIKFADGRIQKMSREGAKIKSFFDGIATQTKGINQLAKKEKIPKATSSKEFTPVLSGKDDDLTRLKIQSVGRVPALYPSGESIRDTYAEDIKESVYTGVQNLIGDFSLSMIKEVGPFDLNTDKVKESTKNLLADKSAIGAISGYIFEGAINALTGAKPRGQEAGFDYDASSGNNTLLKRLFGNIPPEMEVADAKSSFAAGQDILTKKIPAFLVAQGMGLTNYLDDVQYFSEGGLARGTDTVPAMLTPGEVVINKGAAQSFGYDRLAAINNGVQYLSNGGVVSGASRTSQSAANISSHFSAGLNRKDAAKMQSASQRFSTETVSLYQELRGMNVSAQEAQRALQVFAREISKGAVASDAVSSARQSAIFGVGSNAMLQRSSIVAPTRTVDNGSPETRGPNSVVVDPNIKRRFADVTNSLIGSDISDQDLPRAVKVYKVALIEGKTHQEALNKVNNVLRREAHAAANALEIEASAASKARMQNIADGGSPDPVGPVDPVVSARNTANAEAGISRITDGASRAALLLGVFGATISIVAKQFGLFGDDMAETVAQVSTTFSTIFGIGTSVVDVLGSLRNVSLFNVASQEASTAANLAAAQSENIETASNLRSAAGSGAGLQAASLMSKVTLAATGVTLGLAAGMAAAQYYTSIYAQQQAKASEAIKKFTATLERDGKGDASELQKLQEQQLTAEAKSNASGDAGFKGSIAGALAGGITGAIVSAKFGAVIGTAIAPVVGTALGGLIGGGLGLIGGAVGGLVVGGASAKIASDGAQITKNAVSASKSSSEGRTTGSKAIFSFTKEQERLDREKASSGDDLLSTTAATIQFLESKQATTRNFEEARAFRIYDTGLNPTNVQKEQTLADETVAQNLVEQSAKVEKNIRDKISAQSDKLVGRNIKSEDIFASLKPSLEAYKAALEDTLPPEDSKQIYEAFVKSIKESSEANDKLIESQERVNRAYEDQRSFILSVNAALKAISSISDTENMISSSISNFISSIDGGAASFTLAISSGFSDITNIPSMGLFSSQVNELTSIMGPEAKKIGAAVLNASTIFQKAESVLLNKNLASLETIADGDIQDSVSKVADNIFKDIGIEAGSLGPVGDIIKENLKKAIIDKKGGGFIDKATIREILGPLIEQGQDGASVFSGLIEQQQKKVVQYGDLINKISEFAKKEIEIKQSLISSEEKLFNALAEINPNIGAGEKQFANQNFRDRKAAVVTSRIGVRNPNDIGALLGRALGGKSRLNQIIKDQESNKGNAVVTQMLTNEFSVLSSQVADATSRLTELGSQTDRTSDILAKLEKIQSGKKQLTSKVEDFVFGGGSERSEIQKSFMSLSQAMGQGGVQGLSEENRSAVRSLLNDLSDTKIGPRGETGDDIKKLFLGNDLIRSGMNPRDAAMLAGKLATTSEQKIVEELRAVAAQEEMAIIALDQINVSNRDNTISIVNAIAQQTVQIPFLIAQEMGKIMANIPGRANGGGGGVVGNMGVKTSRSNGDNRITTVKDDEFIITGKGRRTAGDKVLHDINSGKMPGRAKGGGMKMVNHGLDFSSVDKEEEVILNPKKVKNNQDALVEGYIKTKFKDKVKELSQPIESQADFEIRDKKLQQKERDDAASKRLGLGDYSPAKPKATPTPTPKAIPRPNVIPTPKPKGGINASPLTAIKSEREHFRELDAKVSNDENLNKSMRDKGQRDAQIQKTVKTANTAFAAKPLALSPNNTDFRSGSAIVDASVQSLDLLMNYKNPIPNSRAASNIDDQNRRRKEIQAETKKKNDISDAKLKNAKPMPYRTGPMQSSEEYKKETERKTAIANARSEAATSMSGESSSGFNAFLDKTNSDNAILTAPRVQNQVQNDIAPINKPNVPSRFSQMSKPHSGEKRPVPRMDDGIKSGRYRSMESRKRSIEQSRFAKRTDHEDLMKNRRAGIPDPKPIPDLINNPPNNGGNAQGQNGPANAANQQPMVNFEAGARTLQAALDTSINRIPQLFEATNAALSTFSGKLEKISNRFNAMEMKHEVNITGNVAITGINTEEIKTKISQALTTEIGNMIVNHINSSNKGLTAGGPAKIPPMPKSN